MSKPHRDDVEVVWKTCGDEAGRQRVARDAESMHKCFTPTIAGRFHHAGGTACVDLKQPKPSFRRFDEVHTFRTSKENFRAWSIEEN